MGSPTVGGPKIGNAPQYGHAGLKKLGLSGEEWGIGVELRFSVDAKEARASRKKEKTKLYIHQEVNGTGLLWNETGAKHEWNVTINEYFELRPGGKTWGTRRDVHNTWYKPSGQGGMWVGTEWCGISIYVKGELTVGRLYTKGGAGLKPFNGPFVFDNKNSSSQGRPKVGVPKGEGGTDIGVTDYKKHENAPEGGFVFKADPMFKPTTYEYWVERDNCPTTDAPAQCGPKPPDDVASKKAGKYTTYKFKETKTVALPKKEEKKK